MVRKSQKWIYSGGCEYDCEFHKGKVEWHHPISERPDVGIYLCEAHHSLLQGRKRKYAEETMINKTLDEMRTEIQHLVLLRLKEHNLSESAIDKK